MVWLDSKIKTFQSRKPKRESAHRGNSQSQPLDQGILLSVLFLIGVGLVQVYSSSFIYATDVYQDGHHFFFRQLAFSSLGILVLLLLAHLKWKFAQVFGVLVFVAGVAGLAMTMIPSFTISAGGAARWVRLPLGLRFEPGEFFKVSYSILLALLLTTRKVSWLGLFDHLRWLAVLLPFLLLLKQPDFGTVALLSMVTIAVLFVFGLSWRYLFYFAATTVPVFYFLVVQVPYRWARIQGFLDPWSDPSEKGFQIIQSLLSFHSGGVFGAGLGQGLGKLFFLPEAHTDFTMAVLGEEVGLIGFLVVLLVYGHLVFRGFQIASRVPRDFERIVVLGFIMTFGLQVFINVGVVLGLLPTKGITLPFLSYGGSSLLATCIGFGWLLNIQRTFAKTETSLGLSKKEKAMISGHYWNAKS